MLSLSLGRLAKIKMAVGGQLKVIRKRTHNVTVFKDSLPVITGLVLLPVLTLPGAMFLFLLLTCLVCTIPELTHAYTQVHTLARSMRHMLYLPSLSNLLWFLQCFLIPGIQQDLLNE